MDKSHEWIKEAIDILEHVMDKKHSPDYYFSGRYRYLENILSYLTERGAITKKPNSVVKGKLLIEVLMDLRSKMLQEDQLKLNQKQSIFSMWMMIATIILAFGTIVSLVIQVFTK